MSKKIENYASILLEVCEELGKDEEIYSNIPEIKKIFTKEIEEFLTSVIISKKNKLETLDLLKNTEISNEVLNLAKIMVEMNDFEYFSTVLDEYQHIYQSKKNIKLVDIYVAKKLSAENIKNIESQLSKRLNKIIHINQNIQQDLVGGIKIVYDNKVIDNTIKKQLQVLLSCI